MSRLLTWAGSFLLILSAVFCSLCAVISAYDFPVNIRYLFLIWLIAALVLSALASLLRGKGLPVALPLVLAVFYYKLTEIAAGGKWVAFYITDEYSHWFSIPVLFQGASATANEVTLFFAAGGIVLAFLLTISVCLWRSAAFTCFLTIPIAVISVMILDFSSNPWFLIGLTAVYLTMIVSSTLYPDDFTKRGMAVFPALAFTVLLLAAAYLAAPQDQYIRDARVSSLENQIKSLSTQGSFNAEQLGADWLSTADWRFNTEYVTVADAGRRIETGQCVLEVSADQAGTFYLRGYSMQMFDGRAWNDNSDMLESEYLLRPADIINQYSLLYPDNAPAETKMAITKTGDSSDIAYLPYYSFYYTNEEPNEVTFFYTESSILGLAAALSPDSFDLSGYNAQARDSYTQVDASTAEGLRRLAAQAGIDSDADRAMVADQVAQYISSSARYTLSPSAIPEDEDFALYFLQTARQGYCIHFATVAALMLRALDIPARFTVGFTVTVTDEQIGETVAVTDHRAHAWVEVYYDDIGWAPLEVTPSTVYSGIPERIPHTSLISTDVPEATLEPTEAVPTPQLPADSPVVTPGDTFNQTPPSDTPGTGFEPRDDIAETGGAGYWAILLVVLCIAAAAASLYLRRRVARAHRAKEFGQDDANAAVICAWQYISRLHGRKRPPEEIEELALKARFSQHALSEDERAAVIKYASMLSEETDRLCNPLQRFWLRYMRGLY